MNNKSLPQIDKAMVNNSVTEGRITIVEEREGKKIRN